jgi:hypothetical protein
LVKDERSDLLADPHKILNSWKNYFCQLLNVHGAGGVRQTEMHTAEPFVPEPSASEVEVAIGKLKRHKSRVFIRFQHNLFRKEENIAFGHSLTYQVDLEQRRITSPAERVSCFNHSHKGR